MILTRNNNRSRLKLKKIDLGKSQTIALDSNNKTQLSDIKCTTIESLSLNTGVVSCTNLTATGSASNINELTSTDIQKVDKMTIKLNLTGDAGVDFSEYRNNVKQSPVLSITGDLENYSSIATDKLQILNKAGGLNMVFDSLNQNGIQFNFPTWFNGGTNNLKFRYNSGNHLYVYSNGVSVMDLVSNGSDDRLKSNEVFIENALSTIKKLKPETYDKMDSINSENPPSRESGVIAQQIWYEVPELRHIVNLSEDASPHESVNTPEDPNQDPDYTALGWGSQAASVNYNGITAYLIKAIQELIDEIDQLKSQLHVY